MTYRISGYVPKGKTKAKFFYAVLADNAEQAKAAVRMEQGHKAVIEECEEVAS